MEVVIIEDEDLAADSLKKLLLKTPYNLNIKKRLESVSEAIEWFKQNNCDLIFSDVSLGDGESFEIFEALNIDTPIIFTTAFDHYAIQSFQFHAVDYLLKPYNQIKLNKALEKYINTQKHKIQFYPNQQNLDNLISRLSNMSEVSSYQTRFLISKGEELLSIKSEETAYFMAEDKSLFLFTRKGEVFLYDDTLYNLENKLSPKDFFKVNRKFIVRHNAIKSIIKYSQSRLKIELQPAPNFNASILISAKNIQSFKEWLNN
ncbi:LytR/AlgR family response regulator transcription factor [Mesonia aestuariivivens]|uniref:LytTR family DNA-binding domain-containing protein n=1 Tax=Mesonia aestuariivivens TaxID=2796128 RepID=A0ABS6W1K3_9FLAO|nr:LytTR family DNA-binding domain-containing protein [Mesonia aestuariivivens]MBW2961731.1 LytTR family DNA-binding domain-containing protein [Mesonia aestuariivivens]